MCETNGTFTKSSQTPHGCVSFASKYRLSQEHFAACNALASSYKSEKHPGKWSGIVSYISLSVKKIVGRRQNNSRRGKQQRGVS